jgi:capsular polysaccharide biosynthesis protein
MSPPRIPPHLGKPDAARLVAAAAGLPELDPYWGPVAQSLEQAERLCGIACNEEIAFAASAPALQEIVLARGHDRVLPPPSYLNGRPDCFPAFPGMWPSGAPTLRGFVLPNAYYCLVADGPVVLSAERTAIVTASSKFARLLHFYDYPMEPMLSDAPFIDGTVLALVDDVFDLNYCHWICDWLSRLAPFKDVLGRDDFFVLTSPIATDWQRRTLELCGVPPERVIAMQPWQAIRARELITLSDISDIHHPMQKGAVWAMSFLRDRLLAPAAAEGATGHRAATRKIYVSRGDAGGRRVLNEDALMTRLSRYGYERVSPGELDFDAQAALFAEASHIIGIHGAGLTNIIFAPSHCRVIEILPRSYGTPAFCVLAGARGMPYYTYVEGAVTASTDSQADDITIDVADFARCAEVLL